MRFSSLTYEANETENSVEVEAILDVELERDVMVDFSTEDRTASSKYWDSIHVQVCHQS